MRRIGVLLAVLAGSQLGHALTYFVRFGVDAARYQSEGVHSYYPPLAAGLGGSLGAVLTTTLLVVAAARCTILAPAGYRPRSTVRFLDVLGPVFAVQLLVFVGQETVEALASGQAVPSAGELLLWGTLGQLPAAAITATVTAWLLVRLDAAWTAIVDGVPQLLAGPTAAVVGSAGRSEDGRERLGSAFPPAFRRRGPPLPFQP